MNSIHNNNKISIAELLAWGCDQLRSDNALLEAQLLLAQALECERSRLYAWPDEVVLPAQRVRFEAFIQRRQNHEPIAYILGQREFWSLPFWVTQDTLVPRHDTECLVEAILNNLSSIEKLNIVDVGTGCGAIACALAHERSNWQLTALDVSEKALLVAKKNAENLKLENIKFLHSDWLSALLNQNQNQRYDAIVGNPPYIRANDVHLVYGDLLFEPKLALTPGPSGLEAFEIILDQAKKLIKPQGLIAFEHGFDQGQAVQDLLFAAGLQKIKTLQDHGGKDRVTLGWAL